jgi:hypothetical protein
MRQQQMSRLKPTWSDHARARHSTEKVLRFPRIAPTMPA